MGRHLGRRTRRRRAEVTFGWPRQREPVGPGRPWSRSSSRARRRTLRGTPPTAASWLDVVQRTSVLRVAESAGGRGVVRDVVMRARRARTVLALGERPTPIQLASRPADGTIAASTFGSRPRSPRQERAPAATSEEPESIRYGLRPRWWRFGVARQHRSIGFAHETCDAFWSHASCPTRCPGPCLVRWTRRLRR